MSATQPHRPIGVRLADVLTTTLPPTCDVHATSCTSDAASVRPGDVYFAPAGDATFVLQGVCLAIEAGAKAVVVDQLLPLPTPVPQFVVRDPKAAFGEFCHAIVGSPCQAINTTAVAGGCGKSSVVRMLKAIYRAAGKPTAWFEAQSFADGATVKRVVNPPTAPLVASWLSRSVANGCQNAIVEAPNAVQDDNRLAGVSLKTLCITNLATPVVDRRSSVEATRLAMCEAAKRLAADGVLVLNADDPASCRFLAEWSGPTVTFGTGPTAQVSGRVLQRHAGGQVFLLRHGASSVAIESATIGDAHFSNCLAAAATALAVGVELKAVARGIESVGPLQEIMQPVVCGQAFPVYLDTASAPLTISSAAQAASRVATGRVLTVVADNSHGTGATQDNIQAAIATSDLVFATGHDIQQSGVRVVEDRFTAIALALALAEPGDAVVVTGCRDSLTQEQLDERTIRQLLELRMRNTDDFATKAG